MSVERSSEPIKVLIKVLLPVMNPPTKGTVTLNSEVFVISLSSYEIAVEALHFFPESDFLLQSYNTLKVVFCQPF